MDREVKGFIEIHHLKTLSILAGAEEVDPHSDLIPLCANCHRMMVYRSQYEVLSLEVLKN